MDFAYDHITEEALPSTSDNDGSSTPTQSDNASSSSSSRPGGHKRNESLAAEFSDTYRTISSSPWGLRFGAIFETVKKQGEVVYDATKHEYTARSKQALELKDSLVEQAKALTLEDENSQTDGEKTRELNEDGTEKTVEEIQERDNLVDRLRRDAMKGLTNIQQAEDMADAYLAKWGSNIGNFLKEAITIHGPESSSSPDATSSSSVLFEKKGSKKAIHTTRLDAQLHLLHTSLSNFTTDPRQPAYASEWSATFSADKRTEQISKDLETYPELRGTMEKLVPDGVAYEEFWKRYYFLRGVVEGEEVKRKELLKVAAKEEEEVGWDEEDSAEEEEEEDDEEEESEEEGSEEEDDEEESEEEDEERPSTAKPNKPTTKPSQDTLKSPALVPRTSTDVTSQPDSEASYDVVSGAPSGAPSNSGESPKGLKGKKEESDEEEEDWE